MKRIPWMVIVFVLFAIYPLIPGLNEWFRGNLETSVGSQISTLFIYAILALSLHIVVGNAGMFHLGIGAFFGIGAYIAGIAMVKVPSYPFQVNFYVAIVLAGLGSAALGVLLSAPTLRLRGDYLALVTLGFGEVIRFTLRNLEEITAGTKGLSPIPPPSFPGVKDTSWSSDYEPFYYLCLAAFGFFYLLIANIERSRLGRAWVALREDELASSCMGLKTSWLKLSAFAMGTGLAGIAGALYAVRQANTADPDFYGFNNSILALSCLILGGLGNRKGVLVGVFLIVGFNNIYADILDKKIQSAVTMESPFLKFGFWKMAVFGLALVLVMRFRPSGFLPESREGAAAKKPSNDTAKDQ